MDLGVLISLTLLVLAVIVLLTSFIRTRDLPTAFFTALLLIVALLHTGAHANSTANAFVRLSGTLFLVSFGLSLAFSWRFRDVRLSSISVAFAILLLFVMVSVLHPQILSASEPDRASELSMLGLGLLTLLGAVVLDRAAKERGEIDAALERRTALCERIINSSRDGVFVLDDELHITNWNPGMERISGFGKREVLGSRISDVFSFGGGNGRDTDFFESFSGVEIVCTCKPFAMPGVDGEETFDAYFSPLKNGSGEIVETLGVIHENSVKPANDPEKTSRDASRPERWSISTNPVVQRMANKESQ